MNLSQTFFRKAVKVFEGENQSFHFGKETPGISFTHNKPVSIPAGSYVVVETDSRDDSRAIILNKKDYKMYALLKKFIPKN